MLVCFNGDHAGKLIWGPDDGKFRVVPADNVYHLWSAPPTGSGDRAPAWLLRLATVCAGRRLNESARLVSARDEFDRFDNLRREIAALPDDAPYATWAKWFLSTDPARSIAPGFTVTPADAQKLEEDLVKFAGEAPVAPASAAPATGRRRKQ